MKPGDLVRFKWAHDKTVVGVVLTVQPPPNYHRGIDFTMEILESDGRKFTYDVWRNDEQDWEVLSEAG
jgi:hypothetical protein